MPIGLIEILELLGVGLAAGVIGGMVGIGGSVIMIPALAMVFHGRAWDDQHLFQASAMVVNVAVSLPAALRHAKANAVPRELVRYLLPATVAAIAVGVFISNAINQGALRRLFALFLVYVAGGTLLKVFRGHADHDAEKAVITPGRGLAIGATTGALGGVLGIGGGLVSVPMAHWLCRLPLRQCIAASASVMVWSSGLGAALKLSTLGSLDLRWQDALMMSVALAPTALIGGYLGAGLTHRLPLTAMRLVFAGVIIVLAAKMGGLW